MKYNYKTKGVCSRNIEIETKDGLIESVKFDGGCAGNTVGLAKMVEGQKIEKVIEKLKGIQCGYKGTSCPDQLATALEEILQK